MKEKEEPGIVPEQHTGKPIDAESSVELASTEEAKTFFQTVKSRLENVNGWHSLAGELSAEFQLVDEQGQEVNRPVQKGDYFKIDVPGPGTKSGEGFDWVRVEAVEAISNANEETFAIRVRPAQNPQGDEKDVAHFYSPDSTSSFTVKREGRKITAGIYDRNTKTNKQANSLTDKIRDAVVGAAGILSFSKIQWSALADGLLRKK